MSTNGLTIGSPLQAWSQKIVYEVKLQWFFCKVKVPGAAASKVCHPNNFEGYKRTHLNWFPWKNVQL